MSRERTRRAEEETKAPVAKKNFFPDINLSFRCEVSDEFQISILYNSKLWIPWEYLFSYQDLSYFGEALNVKLIDLTTAREEARCCSSMCYYHVRFKHDNLFLARRKGNSFGLTRRVGFWVFLCTFSHRFAVSWTLPCARCALNCCRKSRSFLNPLMYRGMPKCQRMMSFMFPIHGWNPPWGS